MARMGKFSCSDLKKLQKQLEGLDTQRNMLMEACAKELASKLLSLVIPRTPVGNYSGGSYECKTAEGAVLQHHSQKVKGKQGGTLRASWTIGNIEKVAGTYKIDVINPVEYALT